MGKRSRQWVVGLLIAACAWALAPTMTFADARTDYLVRLLRSSGSFRVRVQAALSLGRIESDDDAIVPALTRALRDDHPVVRSAAAAALARHGDPSALRALRRARRDRDRAVRSSVARSIRTLERIARTRPREREPDEPEPDAGPARYYVGIGLPGSSVRGMDRSTLESAREFIRGRVGGIDGVRVAPNRESRRDAERVLSRGRLTGYFLDSSIVRIEDRNGGVRAVVSVIVNTYPGRDMRVILQGAATVQGGGSGPTVRRQAIQGALTGALRRLPQAFAAGDARAGG